MGLFCVSFFLVPCHGLSSMKRRNGSHHPVVHRRLSIENVLLWTSTQRQFLIVVVLTWFCLTFTSIVSSCSQMAQGSFAVILEQLNQQFTLRTCGCLAAYSLKFQGLARTLSDVQESLDCTFWFWVPFGCQGLTRPHNKLSYLTILSPKVCVCVCMSAYLDICYVVISLIDSLLLICHFMRP